MSELSKVSAGRCPGESEIRLLIYGARYWLSNEEAASLQAELACLLPPVKPQIVEPSIDEPLAVATLQMGLAINKLMLDYGWTFSQATYTVQLAKGTE